MLTPEQKEHAERMLRHAEKSGAEVEAERRQRIEAYLDTVAAVMELAKTNLRHALKVATTDDGRQALTDMLAKLDECGDEHYAAQSSGLMCAAYEAEVAS